MSALVYLPLGGADEIGMNMYLYGYGPRDNRRWIMVDCGIGFPDAAHAPGVEIMTPDPAFIAAESERLDGIFITHAHEDHIGAVGRLWGRFKAPIYCTKFPAAIARRKLDEFGVSPKNLNVVDQNTPVKAGDFSVSFFPMTHSIPETSALVIDTPLGRNFHTADFKLDDSPAFGDPMDRDAMRKMAEEGVLAIACDSTNVFEPGFAGTEDTIKQPLRDVIAGSKGKVAATTFASNVARLKTLAEAARDSGRAVVVAGRAMQRMIEAAVQTGIMTDFPETITEDEARDIPDDHLFYLVTGSQGESRAAMARIAGDSHPSVHLKAGDTAIFSSKTIPGNETEVSRIYNLLAERGIRVVDDSMADIHVSGHAPRGELEEVYSLLKPKYAIPMHGERRHLHEHAVMAPSWGAEAAFVVPNGSMLQIAPGEPKIVDDVDTGRLYADGNQLIGAMDGVVRSRRKMGMNGHIAVSVILDDNGDLVVESDARVTGAPEESKDWTGEIEGVIAEAVDGAIEKLKAKDRRDDDKVEEAIRRAARSTASRLWGKKPETVVMLTRLD
jgi:ribonuclease J